MDKTLSGKYSNIKRRYGEVCKKRAISFLNIAQFTAAFNDNLFKFLTIYLLIDLKGTEAASDIALFVGVCYVLPFLLFSNMAGAIADLASKQKIIVWMKALEVMIICLCFYVYAYQLVWGCYFCVFLLSLQSAIMSPPKYSIISELVGKEEIAKANSYVTSYTYLAIIFGTFMASFLTQITNRNFILCLTVCLFAAIIGFVASLNIPKTKALGQKINAKQPPFAQLKETLQMCKKTPKLLMAVIGSAFFLFIGAFLQLNLIPYAMISMGMSEVGGGYLFLATSLGIAFGSIISGKICKKGVNLGVSAFAMIAMALLVFIIPFFSMSVVATLGILALIGLFGGLYQIPLESYMQTYSSAEKRGKIVAAGNFLSFCGVLLAPLSMAIFEKGLHVSPGTGFTMLSLILFCASIALVRSLFIPLINFVSKNIVHKFYNIYYQDFPYAKKYEEQRIAIFARGLKKRFIFLLLGEEINNHIFVIRKTEKKIDKLFAYMQGIDSFYLDKGFNADDIRLKLTGILTRTRPIFILEEGVELGHLCSLIHDLKKKYHYHVKEMALENRVHFRANLQHIFQKTTVVFSFNNVKHEMIEKSVKAQVQLV